MRAVGLIAARGDRMEIAPLATKTRYRCGREHVNESALSLPSCGLVIELVNECCLVCLPRLVKPDLALFIDSFDTN